MGSTWICLFLGLGVLLFCADGTGTVEQYEARHAKILKYFQALGLNFQGCIPLDETRHPLSSYDAMLDFLEGSGLSCYGDLQHTDSSTASPTAITSQPEMSFTKILEPRKPKLTETSTGSTKILEPRKPKLTETSSGSTKILEPRKPKLTETSTGNALLETPHNSISRIARENDNVIKCFNATKQNSLDPDSNFYCSVVGSTVSLLLSTCGNDSLPCSLEDTAESFENFLINNSLWTTESKEEVVSAVTLVLEGLGSAAVTAALSSPERRTQTVVIKSGVIQTQLISEEQISKGETVRLEAQGDQVAIDPRAVAGITSQGSGAVSFLSFNGLESLLGNSSSLQNVTLQNGRTLEDVFMNSRVVSASTSSWTRNITIPINLTFHHLEDKDPQKETICVRLDSANKDSAWTPEGCWHLHSNISHSECSCQYLSTYAVLMATSPKQGDLTLFFISYVGLVISLICLFLSIVTFLSCRAVQNSSTFIHLQLGLCLFFADILFLAGIDKTHNKVLCSVIAGLLHYLFLACFVWMFLEGVNLFFIVKNLKVANYGGANKHMRISMYICGYGIPALIVAISAGSSPWAYGTQYHCWLNPDKGFHWSFLGPVCAIIVINTVFFCLILKILHEKLASLNSQVSTLKSTRSLTFKAIAHLFILGLTWCTGLFQFGPLADIMAYVFTLTNSVQGAFIFLVHCLLNQKVREAYWNWISCSKTIQPPTTEISMTATPSSVTQEHVQNSAIIQQQKMTWMGHP